MLKVIKGNRLGEVVRICKLFQLWDIIPRPKQEWVPIVRVNTKLPTTRVNQLMLGFERTHMTYQNKTKATHDRLDYIFILQYSHPQKIEYAWANLNLYATHGYRWRQLSLWTTNYWIRGWSTYARLISDSDHKDNLVKHKNFVLNKDNVHILYNTL